MNEYLAAGADITDDLSTADAIVGKIHVYKCTTFCIYMYYALHCTCTCTMCMYMQKFMCVYSLNTPSSHPKMQY